MGCIVTTPKAGANINLVTRIFKADWVRFSYSTVFISSPKAGGNGAKGGLLLGTVNIPVWEKSNLTLEEAAAYFNIGLNKLRDITNSKAYEKCTLFVGNKRLIKRKIFEKCLAEVYSI